MSRFHCVVADVAVLAVADVGFVVAVVDTIAVGANVVVMTTKTVWILSSRFHHAVAIIRVLSVVAVVDVIAVIAIIAVIAVIAVVTVMGIKVV